MTESGSRGSRRDKAPRDNTLIYQGDKITIGPGRGARPAALSAESGARPGARGGAAARASSGPGTRGFAPATRCLYGNN